MLKKLLLAVLVAAPLCMNAQKFGVINTSEIFNVMPEKATAEATLKSVAEKYDTELKNLQTAFQKKVEEYDAQNNDDKTPQAIKDRHMQELQDEYQKIQNFQQTASQDIQKQQDQLLAPIQTKLQNAITAVGAEGGYTFIYDLSIPSVIYHGAGAEDLTAKVKAKLGIK